MPRPHAAKHASWDTALQCPRKHACGDAADVGQKTNPRTRSTKAQAHPSCEREKDKDRERSVACVACVKGVKGVPRLPFPYR
jgi:hypothetical protein